MNKKLVILLCVALIGQLLGSFATSNDFGPSPNIAFAAIARDATSSSYTGAAASVTLSHTITGSNTILFVSILENATSTDNVSAVTYAGASMTRVPNGFFGGANADNGGVYMYYKIAPAAGTNNIVVTNITNSGTGVFGSSYTGAAQSAQPDSSATGTTSASPLNLTTTVVASNSWLTGACYQGGGGTAPTAGAGTFILATANSAFQASIDSSGTVGTGAQTLVCNYTGAVKMYGAISSIAPFVAASGATRSRIIGHGFSTSTTR